MDKAKAKLKAEQLMKLALSTAFTEEARTAAMSAVEIISRHGLVISTGEAPPKPPAPPTRVHVDVADFFRRATEAVEQQRRREQESARKVHEEARQQEQRRDQDFFVNWNKRVRNEEDILDEGVWIPSKFKGHCAACGEPYFVGDQVLWKRGKGCMCIPCFDERRSRGRSG